MAFGDDLAEKVAEIRRAALDGFAEWLRLTSGNEITVDDDRTRVVGGRTLPPEALDDDQTEFERFLTELDEMEQRFARYYPLNSAELAAVRSSLCRSHLTALGENWTGGLRYSEQWPGNVVDRIDYAASIVLQASEPEDMQAPATWKGPAADRFNDNFLVPFREFAAKQIFSGLYLANVAEIFFNVTIGTQRDLKAIADACIAALRDEPQSLSETLSDLSVFANLLGFVLPAPVDDLVGLGSIALESAASRAAEREERPDWRIKGGYLQPWVVIASAIEVLTEMETRLADRDHEVYSALTRDVSDYFYSADFELRPERPDPPDRIDEVLVVNIESIYEYGARYLPAAGAQYDEALRELHECLIPEWFGDLLLTRSRHEFIVARNGLRPALVRTRDHLTDASEALVAICNEYQWADAAGAAEFEQFKDALPPPQPVNRPSPHPPATHHMPL